MIDLDAIEKAAVKADERDFCDFQYDDTVTPSVVLSMIAVIRAAQEFSNPLGGLDMCAEAFVVMREALAPFTPGQP